MTKEEVIKKHKLTQDELTALNTFTLLSADNGDDAPVERTVTLSPGENGLYIGVSGHELLGEQGDEIILLDAYYPNEFKVKIWTNKEEEDFTHDIDLNLAKTNHENKEVK